jgi:hypothetical protein
VLPEELHSSFERSLLPSFDQRFCDIPTYSKPVRATREILALVPWGKFPIAEDFIGLCLGFGRELLIEFTGVDQERRL